MSAGRDDGGEAKTLRVFNGFNKRSFQISSAALLLFSQVFFKNMFNANPFLYKKQSQTNREQSARAPF